MYYLDFLAEEVRSRRRQLGLTARDKALVMMDQAGAHISKTYRKLQMQWCERHNIEAQHSNAKYVYIYICI